MDLDILLQWIIALSFVSMTIYFSIKARQIETANNNCTISSPFIF